MRLKENPGKPLRNLVHNGQDPGDHQVTMPGRSRPIVTYMSKRLTRDQARAIHPARWGRLLSQEEVERIKTMSPEELEALLTLPPGLFLR